MRTRVGEPPEALGSLFWALHPPATDGGSARPLCLEQSGKAPCRRWPGDGDQRAVPCSFLAGRLQIEQVSQLSALVDAQLDYHRQAVQILDELANKLKRR